MTDKTSLFELSKLPQPFGVILLVLSLILLLSPYLSGADFGVFKVPNFAPGAKKWLKVIGPILFIMCILSFIPTIPSPSKQGSLNITEQRQGAENIASEWFAAYLSGDAATVVKLSSTPFYFDNEILLRPSDIRKQYEDLFSGKGGNWKNAKIASMKTQTIAELKQQGYDTNRDRVLRNLNLRDEDFAVSLSVSIQYGEPEGLLLFIRSTENGLRVAAMWG